MAKAERGRFSSRKKLEALLGVLRVVSADGICPYNTELKSPLCTDDNVPPPLIELEEGQRLRREDFMAIQALAQRGLYLCDIAKAEHGESHAVDLRATWMVKDESESSEDGPLRSGRASRPWRSLAPALYSGSLAAWGTPGGLTI